MSLVNYGKEFWYAQSRLCGSLVRSKDKAPICVNDMATTDGRIFGMNTITGKETSELFLEDLNLEPFNPGYVNVAGTDEVLYLVRVPARYYKQGLNKRNVRFFATSENSKVSRVDLYGTEVGRSIAGMFPTFQSCRNYCDVLGKGAQAFSNDFSLRIKKTRFKLEYQTYEVGKLDVNGKPILSQEYEYLSDELLEALKCRK